MTAWNAEAAREVMRELGYTIAYNGTAEEQIIARHLQAAAERATAETRTPQPPAADVEAVAQAISEADLRSWPDASKEHRERYLKLATAALVDSRAPEMRVILAQLDQACPVPNEKLCPDIIKIDAVIVAARRLLGKA
jgi:hypothetical protein